MDVFDLRQTLISKYQDYVQSFIRIRNKRIEELVNDELKAGLLWPRPLVQLNPFFERGKSIPKLADERVLSEDCKRIFRVGKSATSEGSELTLHRHQEQAVRVANSPATTAPGTTSALTPGTDPAKSPSSIIPILQSCLRAHP